MIHLILMRIRMLDSGSSLDKKGSGTRSFLKDLLNLTSRSFKFIVIFLAYFYAKTWWTIQKSEIFIISLFSIVFIWVLRVKQFFFWILSTVWNKSICLYSPVAKVYSLYSSRMTLVSLLPLAHPAQCGNLYLANLGVPCNVFKAGVNIFL